MSWTFRKIFSLGPFKATASKGGIGMSMGFPGLRIGVSANGKKYVTIGIPGTGLYFTKYLSKQKTLLSKPTNHTKSHQQQPPIKTDNNEPWWKQKNL